MKHESYISLDICAISVTSVLKVLQPQSIYLYIILTF